MNPFIIYSETWLVQLLYLVQQLYHVPEPLSPDLDQETQNLITNVIFHYSNFYTVQGIAANYDVLAICTAPWASPVEQTFLWLAGWRPTTMFQLILSEASTHYESHLTDFLDENRIGDLTELASHQWNKVGDLQCETVREENNISDEMADWQMESAIEFFGHEPDVNNILRKLVDIVKKANNLRLKTLSNLVKLLTPQQVVQFMLASAELLFGVREFRMQAYQSNI